MKLKKQILNGVLSAALLAGFASVGQVVNADENTEEADVEEVNPESEEHALTYEEATELANAASESEYGAGITAEKLVGSKYGFLRNEKDEIIGYYDDDDNFSRIFAEPEDKGKDFGYPQIDDGIELDEDDRRLSSYDRHRKRIWNHSLPHTGIEEGKRVNYILDESSEDRVVGYVDANDNITYHPRMYFPSTYVLNKYGNKELIDVEKIQQKIDPKTSRVDHIITKKKNLSESGGQYSYAAKRFIRDDDGEIVGYIDEDGKEMPSVADVTFSYASGDFLKGIDGPELIKDKYGNVVGYPRLIGVENPPAFTKEYVEKNNITLKRDIDGNVIGWYQDVDGGHQEVDIKAPTPIRSPKGYYSEAEIQKSIDKYGVTELPDMNAENYEQPSDSLSVREKVSSNREKGKLTDEIVEKLSKKYDLQIGESPYLNVDYEIRGFNSKEGLEKYRADYRAAAFKLLNDYRKENGVSPVKYLHELDALVDQRVNDARKVFTHERPDGSSIRAYENGLTDNDLNITIGGNLSRSGYSDVISPSERARRDFDGWIHSEGHNRNLLYPYYKWFATSTIFDGKEFFSVQQFAAPYNVGEPVRIQPVKYADNLGLIDDDVIVGDGSHFVANKKQADQPQQQPRKQEKPDKRKAGYQKFQKLQARYNRVKQHTQAIIARAKDQDIDTTGLEQALATLETTFQALAKFF